MDQSKTILTPLQHWKVTSTPHTHTHTHTHTHIHIHRISQLTSSLTLMSNAKSGLTSPGPVTLSYMPMVINPRKSR